MAGAGEADDLTQEVFIRAWSKLGTFKGEAQFGTWLHRLAVNYIQSRRAVLKKREERFFGGDGLLASVMAPRKRASGAALDLEQAIGRLPARAKQVFVLYDVEGFGHDEIAQELEISVGTSKSQLHRARMLLREHLES
jgi:RNA polymerase sigma-70 factor (ECF subfamily)